MSRQLPKMKLDGKVYFVDDRLCQLRNVENPHDFIDITPTVAWAIAIRGEQA